ncbi:MAG: hypothetical protein ABI889_03815 [Gemmatimonadota bacterium]
MEDSSEDLPKPPRRAAARPFFSPRPSSGEGVTGPLELIRRRAAQLFTPPGSSPAAPLVDRAAATDSEAEANAAHPAPSDAADGSSEVASQSESFRAESSLADVSAADSGSDVDFEGDWTPPPRITPERTLDAESLLADTNRADDDRLVVEQFEPKEIELTPAAVNAADEHAIEVIAYDDANSLLKAAANDGETPEVDGLRLESTEFSFEQAPPKPRMNVDSFWASAPFGRVDESSEQASATTADDTEATMDEETAGEPVLAADSAPAELSSEDQLIERGDDPSTMISHAQAALEPEPEHDPAPAPEPAPMLADISPPWMSRLTPVNSRALEELKESEPWDLTPAQGIESVADEPQASDAPAGAAPAGHGIAEALVRIAARVRDGELAVPADADLSDEAALSAVLTALLRARR